jgi:hypothetical protein
MDGGGYQRRWKAAPGSFDVNWSINGSIVRSRAVVRRLAVDRIFGDRNAAPEGESDRRPREEHSESFEAHPIKEAAS